MSRDRRKAEIAGRWAERLAAIYLRLQGFSIIAQRYKTHIGEIDLIARRGRLLVFAEVKARAKLDDAANAVGAASMRRIEAASDLFLANRPRLAMSDMRYDILAVSAWRIRHIRDAWRPEA